MNEEPKERLRVNKSFQKLFPSNCPLIEKTADGIEVGTCCFYMEDGTTCPRHGDIAVYLYNNYYDSQRTNKET